MGSSLRLPHLISGRTALIIVIVTTATGGFILGYLVGQKTPPSAAPSLSEQPESDIASTTNLQTPTVPAGDGSVRINSLEQPSIPVDKQAAAASASVERTLKGNNIPEQVAVRNGSSEPLGRMDRPASDKKGASGERLLPISSKPDRETRKDRLPNPDIARTKKSTSYTVQAGAFGRHKDAVALTHRLETNGYKASIKEEKNSSGKVLFKVRVGEFRTKQDAMATVRNLRKFEDIDALAIARNQ